MTLSFGDSNALQNITKPWQCERKCAKARMVMRSGYGKGLH